MRTSDTGAPALAALGIDVGTSGCRALVCDEHGGIVSQGVASYGLSSPRAGWAEQAPEDWWNATVSAVRAAVQNAGSPRIVGVGLSGQMHGVVLLDSNLSAVRPAILWCDTRAGATAARVVDELGLEHLIAVAGNPPLAGFTGPQVRWLAENEPTSLSQARWLVCAKDYIRANLTGTVAMDHSDASGTGFYAIADSAWDPELAVAYRAEPDLLPPILESGECAGQLAASAAGAMALQPGLPVAAGGADNASSALGSGVTRPGQLLISIGTSGTIIAPIDRPAPDPTGRCHLFRHVEPASWYQMAVVLDAGGSFAWWHHASQRAIDQTADAAAAIPPGSGGVLVLPYFSGRRMPRNQPWARGTITGLSHGHGFAHVARAAIEGACYAIADGLDCLRDRGVSTGSALVTGGALQHRVWREALTLALPETTLWRARSDQGAALGAALLGFQAAGVEPNVASRAGVHRRLVEDGALQPEAYDTIAAGRPRFQALSEDPLLVGMPAEVG